MADPNHQKILLTGAAAWAKWRTENPAIKPDLSSLTMVGLNLFRMNLSHTNLDDSNLTKANLRESDLSGASLGRANLSEAIFSKSKLTGANLKKADLIGAKMPHTDLRKANLGGADLFGADLTGADLRWAGLAEANLSSAIITGARLYGSIRDGWKIDSIICEHVFWDAPGRQRIPAADKFADHQFEFLCEGLRSPQAHFTESMTPRGALEVLVLKRATNDGSPGISPAMLSKSLLAYLNAIADLQHLINEYSEKPGPGVAIVSIRQQKHIAVELSGAGPVLSLLRESILPWRGRHAREVEKISRALAKARIIEREAEILEIRSELERNPVEARMFAAEAAKKHTETDLLIQQAEEIRGFIFKTIEADLLQLLPGGNMPRNRMAQFRNRAMVLLQTLSESDLAD